MKKIVLVAIMAAVSVSFGSDKDMCKSLCDNYADYNCIGTKSCQERAEKKQKCLNDCKVKFGK